jgi:hypothetical protein
LKTLTSCNTDGVATSNRIYTNLEYKYGAQTMGRNPQAGGKTGGGGEEIGGAQLAGA